MISLMTLAFAILTSGSGNIKIKCSGGKDYVSKTVHDDNPKTEFNTLTYLKQFDHLNIIEIQSGLGDPVPDEKYPSRYCRKFLLEKCEGDAFSYFGNLQKSTKSYNEKMFELIRFAIQVMSALSLIHSKQIYHMDIKPENVFYTISYGKIVFKLADFGSALSKIVGIYPKRSTDFLTKYYCPNEAFTPINGVYTNTYVGIETWDTFALAKMIKIYVDMFNGGASPNYNIYGFCSEYPYTSSGNSLNLMLNRMMHCNPYERPSIKEVTVFFKEYKSRFPAR